VAAAVVLLVVAVMATRSAGPLLMAIAAALGALLAVERDRVRRRRARRSVAEATEECVLILAAEMAAGRSAGEALAAAGSVGPVEVAEAAAVAGLGGDPVPVLCDGAQRHGAAALRQVAAAWQLASATGAPLAELLGRVTQVVRDEAATAREVEEQLAPVRATGRVLAGLPLMGVVIGAGVGVDVPSLLLLTTWGQLCLLTALGLVAAGLTVIDRIGSRAAS
jgi:tight adherence protein B